MTSQPRASVTFCTSVSLAHVYNICLLCTHVSTEINADVPYLKFTFYEFKKFNIVTVIPVWFNDVLCFVD